MRLRWSRLLVDRVIELGREGKQWSEVGRLLERPANKVAQQFFLHATLDDKAARLLNGRYPGGRPRMAPIGIQMAPATPAPMFADVARAARRFSF